MITKDDILITRRCDELLETDRIEIKATLLISCATLASKMLPTEAIDLIQEEAKSDILKVLYKEKDDEIASLKRQLRHSGICVFD